MPAEVIPFRPRKRNPKELGHMPAQVVPLRSSETATIAPRKPLWAVLATVRDRQFALFTHDLDSVWKLLTAGWERAIWIETPTPEQIGLARSY